MDACSFEIQDKSKCSIITVTLYYVQEDYHILSY